MKIRNNLLIVGLIAALGAGCATTTSDNKDATDTKDAGTQTTVDTGTRDTVVDQGTVTVDPLNDPASPLYQKTVYFDFNSDAIKPEGRDTIIAHAQHLSANPNKKITLEGHADERGTVEYNIALGERRANAVKRLMTLQGASSSQIEVVSFGEERPVDPGHTESAWSKNRRAEIVYSGQ